MKLAIFGGSFDPPHYAHLQIIETTLKNFDIDKLIVLVAYQNPLKQRYRIDAQKRFEFMQRLTTHYKKVECHNYEIIQNKPVSSIQSLEYFQNLYKPSQSFLIIGEDNLMQLPQWQYFDLLKTKAHFIVFARNPDSHQNNLYEKEKCMEFAKSHGITIHYLDFQCNISSTQIINNLSTHLLDIPSIIRNEVVTHFNQERTAVYANK